MTEIWKSLVGWEDAYAVSSHGRVKRIERIQYNAEAKFGYPRKLGERLLAPPIGKNGYPMITIRTPNRKPTWLYVHEVVMRAFVGERPKGAHICHNDGDKTNNDLVNLRYDTPKGNAADMFHHGTLCFGDKRPEAKLTNKQAADKYGVSWVTIHNIGKNVVYKEEYI